MNGDLISRKALLEEYEWLKSVVNPCNMAEVEEHMERIRNAPAVEAELVFHSRWVTLKQRPCGSRHDCYCFLCGQHGTRDYERCPRCGAYMDEEVADV